MHIPAVGLQKRNSRLGISQLPPIFLSGRRMHQPIDRENVTKTSKEQKLRNKKETDIALNFLETNKQRKRNKQNKQKRMKDYIPPLPSGPFMPTCFSPSVAWNKTDPCMSSLQFPLQRLKDEHEILANPLPLCRVEKDITPALERRRLLCGFGTSFLCKPKT